MTRPKITIMGDLSFSVGGLLYPVVIRGGKPPKVFTVLLEAMDVENWPGVGQPPDWPNVLRDEEATRKHQEALASYNESLHSDLLYKHQASEFYERQRREPHQLHSEFPADFGEFWAYRDKVLRLENLQPEDVRDKDADILLIKHFVLRREREYQRIKREVEALENIEKLEGVAREPISESIRLFVWQRDKGQCVKCGSRGRLEFDHIIPIAAGGSSTERNIQLLCEACNRSKGATI